MLENPGTVILDRGNYTTCTINLLGATVVSWIYNQVEQLFVNRKTIYNFGAPIQGGIPFVFPQYGPWSLGPTHGFARVIPWTIHRAPTKLRNKDIEAIFSLSANKYTKSMWHYDFKIFYRITLREKMLDFDILIFNTSDNFKLPFNIALCTHLKVPDVRKIKIEGLQRCKYLDKESGKRFVDNRKFVEIKNKCDLIYENVPAKQMLLYGIEDRKLRVGTSYFSNVLISNPWIKEGDCGDEEYEVVLGFGVGEVSKLVVLKPGYKFEAKYKLEVVKDYDKIIMYYF